MAATTLDPALLGPLEDLGFTGIEALVYAFLAQNEPSTGYRISHAIGKPTANTYKAVASLVQQGAVQVDEGGSRLIRAVPPDELLATLERRARKVREAARAALASRSTDVSDDRLYALTDPEQVLERARAMLSRAREIVLADLFPAPFDALAEPLAAAARRGVRVVVKTYVARAVPGVEIVRDGDAARSLEAWPGQQLTLVVDAGEHLLALLDGAPPEAAPSGAPRGAGGGAPRRDASLSRVHQAVWSRSTFLSCLHHNHVAMELLATARKKRGGSRALDTISLLVSRPPGLRRLQERIARPAAAPGGSR